MISDGRYFGVKLAKSDDDGDDADDDVRDTVSQLCDVWVLILIVFGSRNCRSLSAATAVNG